MKPTQLSPECGEYTHKSKGTVTGVMLVANVPNPRGQWWVGGKHVALIRSVINEKQTKLWTRINKIVREKPDLKAVLRAIRADQSMQIVWSVRS